MILRDVAQRPLVRHAAVLVLVVVVGLVHRRATPDALADDRLFAREPPWVQVAAPLWHAAVHSSPSVAHRLTRVADPLTAASTTGDLRALAAVAAALAAGILFVVQRRVGVPPIIALALSLATSGAILPVATAVSLAHALQMLIGAGMLLAAAPPLTPSALRLAVLVGLTVVGALNHASFLAFAAAVWGMVCYAAGAGARIGVALNGAVALGVGLIAAAAMISASAATAGAESASRPGLAAIGMGLVTGRFAAAWQPVQSNGLAEVWLRLWPAPLILSVPLAALAFLRRDRRRVAATSGLAAAALWIFTSGSWLYDATVASAPARVALLFLVGLGLAAVSAVPTRGAMPVAVLASVVIGVSGWFLPSRWNTVVATARLQTFAEAAAERAQDDGWMSDRLAMVREVLVARGALAASRVAIDPDVTGAIADERRILVLDNALRTLHRGDVWTAPIELRFGSVAGFLASQPEWTWLAIARRGGATSGVCRDLLSRLGVDPAHLTGAPVALLSRVDRSSPAAVSTDRLDLPWSDSTGTSLAIPAHFLIETSPEPRVAINGTEAGRAPAGMVAAAFDPWTQETSTWMSPTCAASDTPLIPGSRLRAGYFMGFLPDENRPPAIPVVDSLPVRARLDEQGHGWFGAGWHGPEGRDPQAIRWTSARDAQVHVLVSRRQDLRVRVAGALATEPGSPNALGVSWNNGIIQPLGAWVQESAHEWTIPASLVRRGPNVLTLHVERLVSPSAGSATGDARRLGLRLTELSIGAAASVAR